MQVTQEANEEKDADKGNPAENAAFFDDFDAAFGEENDVEYIP